MRHCYNFCSNSSYSRLLEGRLSNELVPNTLRTTRKTVQTAPPGCRTGGPGLSAAGSALVIAPRTAATALPHRVKSQLELVDDNRRERPSTYDHAEEFLKQLREKDTEDELLLKELSETDIEAILLKRIQNGLSRVPFPKHANNLPCDRWARPRESGFYTFSKPDSTPGYQSKFADSLSSERWFGQTESGVHSFLKADNTSSLILPKEVSVPRLEIVNDEHYLDRIAGTGKQERSFDMDVLSSMDSGTKRRFKRKPVELRIHEFLEKLEVIKKDQEKKVQHLPFWEKRRQWMALTRVVGTTIVKAVGDGGQ